MSATGDSAQEALEASPRERLLNLKRALQNIGPEASSPSRARLEEMVREAEDEVRRREADRANSQTDWRLYLETLRDNLATQAKIFSDITVTGRELPGLSGLLPDAARFLATHHKVFDSFFHSNSSAAAFFKVESLPALVDVILEHPRVAILGEPGAGKSTTSAAMAHYFADRSLSNLQIGLDPTPIPVFVELGGMEGQGLDSYIFQMLASTSFPQSAGSLHSGETILLLDGLNEMTVPDAESVRQWLVANPDAKVIITCRTLDYVERDLPLRRIEIQPLDPTQVHGLISKFLPRRDADRLFWALAGTEAYNCWRWYQRTVDDASFDEFWFGDVGPTYSYEVEKRKIARFQAAARSGTDLPGMLGVVSNPMLLSAAMMLYLRNSSLPTKRERLIEEVALSLFERIDISGLLKTVPGGKALARSAEGILREIIITTAYDMIADGRGTGVELDWFRKVAQKSSNLLRPEVVAVELERAGIFETYGGIRRIIKFRHQLLQEYYASVLLESRVENGLSPADFWDQIPQRMPTAWDETVLLAAARVNDIDRFIRWIADGNPSLAFRAAEASLDRCSPDLYEALRHGSLGAGPCPIARAGWWTQHSGTDRRPGVGRRIDGLPDLSWIRVPGGRLTFGDGAVAAELGLSVKPRTLMFSYDFAITKYEITRAQYAAFVEQGYTERKYWDELGYAWRGSQREPRFWNDPVLGRDNQPVVGETWFEACAFARWVNDIMHSKPELVPEWVTFDFEVRLPLVCEWEYAARYPDGRRFPWGNDYAPGAANIDETYDGSVVGPYFLQRPTPVGIYEEGKSELGIYDLAGNVWEWCLSRWVPGYEFPEVIDMPTVDHRAVRGGSWYNSATYAISAIHDCHDADLGVNDIGFRLVLRPVGATVLDAHD